LRELAERVLDVTNSFSAGFVILGEIEGLVGTHLIRSPGTLVEDKDILYPEIREWISFSGERVFPDHQALLFGLAVKSDERLKLFPQARPENGIFTHIHTAVFPYQTLQNGKIEMQTSMQKFFNGPPPLALFHLVDDFRPAVGLGQSALIRGACWCSAINNPEALL
jgi:hypothetical protein